MMDRSHMLGRSLYVDKVLWLGKDQCWAETAGQAEAGVWVEGPTKPAVFSGQVPGFQHQCNECKLEPV